MFGESSKIFKPWEIHPLKDLWFYFNRITHKGEMQDKKGNVQTKFKLRNLKQSLEEGVNDPDFFRYIYGNKLTNCKYYNDLYRLFYWAAIEPNLEMSRLHFTRAGTS